MSEKNVAGRATIRPNFSCYQPVRDDALPILGAPDVVELARELAKVVGTSSWAVGPQEGLQSDPELLVCSTEFPTHRCVFFRKELMVTHGMNVFFVQTDSWRDLLEAETKFRAGTASAHISQTSLRTSRIIMDGH